MEGHELVTPIDPSLARIHDIRRRVCSRPAGSLGSTTKVVQMRRHRATIPNSCCIEAIPIGVVRIDIDATGDIVAESPFVQMSRDSGMAAIAHTRAAVRAGCGCVRLVSYVAADAVEFYQRCGFTIESESSGASGREPVYVSKALELAREETFGAING